MGSTPLGGTTKQSIMKGKIKKITGVLFRTGEINKNGTSYSKNLSKGIKGGLIPLKDEDGKTIGAVKLSHNKGEWDGTIQGVISGFFDHNHRPVITGFSITSITKANGRRTKRK